MSRSKKHRLTKTEKKRRRRLNPAHIRLSEKPIEVPPISPVALELLRFANLALAAHLQQKMPQVFGFIAHREERQDGKDEVYDRLRDGGIN